MVEQNYALDWDIYLHLNNQVTDYVDNNTTTNTQSDTLTEEPDELI